MYLIQFDQTQLNPWFDVIGHNFKISFLFPVESEPVDLTVLNKSSFNTRKETVHSGHRFLCFVFAGKARPPPSDFTPSSISR